MRDVGIGVTQRRQRGATTDDSAGVSGGSNGGHTENERTRKRLHAGISIEPENHDVPLWQKYLRNWRRNTF